MKILMTTSIICLVLFSGTDVVAQRYTITGSVSGLVDSTWLFLRTAKPDKKIDSCIVIDGRFKLSGDLTEKAMHVYLYTLNYSNYVGFWIENGEVSISLSAGEFKKGSIKGSATQDEYVAVNHSVDMIRTREDSLAKMLKITSNPKVKQRLVTEKQRASDEVVRFYVNYVREHPRSVIAAYLLNVYSSTWGKDTAAVLYNGLSTELQVSQSGMEIKEYIDLATNIKAGDRYVDFGQANADGRTVRLSGIKGKYILLDFWASWCAPCRQDNPMVVELYQQYKTRGFEILSVALDDNKDHWLRAVKEDKLTWENVSDLRGDRNRAALIYNVNAIPTNFLIDESGIIIAKNLRGDELRKKLEELMP